jgi:hypothetical protein
MRDQVSDWLAFVTLVLFIGTMMFGCHCITGGL